MRLTIAHKSLYRFDEPRKHILQSLRLFPSEFSGQTIIDWSVDVPGGVAGSEFRDGAGDLTRSVRVPGPVDRVEISVTGVVETVDLAGVLRGHREKVPPQAYMSSTRTTRVDVAIKELAVQAVEGLSSGDKGTLSQAHALCDTVCETITYTPGATGAQTTAVEALAAGQGVCQDHAHVMIAAARSLGVPGRYVTGYVFAQDADAQERDVATEAETEASHAWAELFIDGLGWVGFDAANGCCPDDRYIRICSGADAADAAPIRGLVAGQGDETLEVEVAVAAIQQ